jgi:hypothetical protein
MYSGRAKKFRSFGYDGAAAAAAASSSSSSSAASSQSTGRWGRNHDFLERVHRELYKTTSNGAQRAPTNVQQSIAQVLQNSFSEWTWCERHGRILDNKTNMTGSRNKECGVCSIQPVMDAYTAACETVPSNLNELLAVREQWVEAFEDLVEIKTKVEADGQNITDSGIGLYSSIDKQELQSWQAYSVVVFDLVRRHLIRTEYTPRINMIAKGRSRDEVIASMKKDSPTLEQYERLLVDWTVDAVAHSGDMRPTNQLFCFVHNQVGDMVPIQGFDGYDTSCWICPLALERSQQNSSRVRLTEAKSMATFVASKDITLVKGV